MLSVKLLVYGHVREFLPNGSAAVTLNLAGPTTVRDACIQAGLNPDLVMRAFMDGQQVDKDHVIDRPAELVLVSPTAGG